MGSFANFLIVYLLGGFTLIPLVLSIIVLYVYLTLSDAPTLQQTCEQPPDVVRHPTDDAYSLKSGTDQLAEKFYQTHDSDVAAGYFAVCREYIPGGVNGKPPERTTPTGEVVATESPSVYQAMYRSLFERKQTPSIEPTKANDKSTRRARNVFFIVLRHGHLMLYDDANQVEVRYVISLAHHHVSLHGGEGEIPEGELWIKRNAICLSRRLESLGELGGPTPPFFLFSENLSEKEDFYFAMLQNQQKLWDTTERPPTHQEFNVKHLITLVQRLHSSEEQLQTRWINAILGRLFLSLYQTPELHEFVRNKIAKKISRMNKPNFISKIDLQNIDMGEGIPFITNPRLKDLTADGNCCVEADLQYTGNFRVEISATVRIDLGPRFKAREVDIKLAVVLKKLEGHLLLRFKPPPSNRLWMSFETMPRMSMHIQPIVSSKQITYNIILRTIESRIREAVAESIVLPFWDDVPFLDTAGQPFRGGIWKREEPQPEQTEIPDESGDTLLTPKSTHGNQLDVLKSKDDRTMSLPLLSESLSNVKSRNVPKKPTRLDLQPGSPTAVSTGVQIVDHSPLPPTIQSQTFSQTAAPVVTADKAILKRPGSESKTEDNSSATSMMIETSNRPSSASPWQTLSISPYGSGPAMPEHAVHIHASSITEPHEGTNFANDHVNQSPPTGFEHSPFNSPRSSQGSSVTSIASEHSRRRSTIESLTKSFATASSSNKSAGTTTIGSATAMAKKWGWGVFGKSETHADRGAKRPLSGTPDEPIGRGHPHLPPGAPLPHPDRYALKRNSGNVPKRKPITSLSLSERSDLGDKEGHAQVSSLPRRKPIPSTLHTDSGTDELLVVEGPQDSAPSSPAIDDIDLTRDPAHSSLLVGEIPPKDLVRAEDRQDENEDGPGIGHVPPAEQMRSISSAATSNSNSSSVPPSLEQIEITIL